ncbi:hypothetical protein E2C01_096886 [Portunus trituberculatus]|uniref:Uncharacterized protein n=1 Tax=Portunus trituberculatus TaxID=210409 RepID=A0A5B7JYZ6_PORTR|nr:hypothetical protein [Portunus trituberculatus]
MQRSGSDRHGISHKRRDEEAQDTPSLHRKHVATDCLADCLRRTSTTRDGQVREGGNVGLFFKVILCAPIFSETSLVKYDGDLSIEYFFFPS